MKRYVGARAIGGILTLGGSVILAGWLMHVPTWHYFAPPGPQLPVSGALCFALFGVALLGAGEDSALWRHIRLGATWLAAVLATLMFCETALSLDLGIDLPELHRWYADNNPYPGRVSPNTSLALMLAAISLHMRIKDTPEGVFFHALPAAVMTLALLGVVAELSLFDLAYTWYNVPHMSVVSSAGLILLGIALIVDRRPRATPKQDAYGISLRSFEHRAYAFLGVSITILAGLAFVSYGSIRALIERRAWVEHTTEVTTEFETLNAAIAGLRGAWQAYTTTGDASAKQQLLQARGLIFARLDRLAALTADNASQQGRLKELRRLGDENIAILSQQSQGPPANAAAPQAETRWHKLMANSDRFEALIAEFRAVENRLLTERRVASDEGVRATIWVIAGGNAIGFALMFFAGWQFKQQSELRDRLLTALQESYVFLDSLIEHIPSVITVKDAKDLRVMRVNRAGEEMLGIQRADAIGKTNHDMFSAEAADVYTATDRAALDGKNLLRVSEQTVVTRGNNTRIILTKKIPIADETGKPKYLLSISEDITQRKMAEREIAALNQRLSARANELEASNKELESFTYSVSHDLRAPLRAINGYALMLEEDYRDRLDDEARRYILQIRNYSQQMGALIDDLLRLSRFGRQSLQLIEVDMARLVREVVDEEAPQYPSTTVRIGDLPNVRADLQLLRLVWSNLIANAFKYSSKNANAVIEIGGRKSDDEAIYSVKDNGIGFDMTYYEKLFSVFSRLHPNGEFPGTGVGLAIVHRVIVRHGGRVWAEGAVEKGATFYFALPVNTVAT